MLSFLLPKEVGFFDHFEAHAGLAHEGAQALTRLLADPSSAETTAAEVKALERRADEVARQCVRDLHSTFITPLERGDIHRLTRRLDEAMDHLDGVARRVHLYRLAAVPDELVRLGALLLQATEQLVVAFDGLREMRDPQGVFAACARLVELEEESDQLYAQAVARLFAEGSDPLEVVKLREVLAVAEGGLDACEEVGRILEGVVLEHL